MGCLSKLPLYFLVFVVLVSGVLGTNLLEGSGFWSNYQSKESGEGVNYGSGVMNFPAQFSTSSINYGSNFQPLVADFNGDGINEIAVTSASYLFALTATTGNIVIKDQFTMPVAQTSQASMVTDRDTGKIYLVMPGSQVLRFYGLNASSQWFLFRAYNVTVQNLTFGSGVVCTSLTDASFGDSCFWVSSTKRWSEYYFKLNTTGSFHLGLAPDDLAPVISSNFNGVKAAVGLITGSYRVVAVVAPLSLTFTGFTANHSSQHLGNYFFQGNQIGGNDLLVVQDYTGTPPCTRAYDSALTNVYGYADTSTRCGLNNWQFAVPGKFSAAVRQICKLDSANDNAYCYNQTGAVVDRIVHLNNFSKTVGSSAFAVDVNGDGFTEIFDGSAFTNARSDLMVNLSTNVFGMFAVADVTGDNNLDLVSSISGKTFVTTATTAFLPSSVNVSLLRSASRNLGSPVCLGTTVTFTHKDCAYYPLDSCSYVVNRNSTQEYLYSTCGNLSINPLFGPFFVGLPSLFTPELSCYFSHVGVVPDFRLYATTTISGTNPATDAYETVRVTVINGTPGLDCNLAPFLGLPIVIPSSVAPSLPNASQRNELQYWGTAGGSVPLVIAGFLILIGLTVGVIVFLAKEAKVRDGKVLSVVGCLVFIIGLIALTYYGFFPIWILLVTILFSCVAIGYLIFSKLSVAS